MDPFTIIFAALSTAASAMQARQQARRQQQAATEQARREYARLEKERARAEEKRQKQLRQAVAKRRASFAGRGIVPTGGSAQALIQGIRNDSAEENRDAAETYNQNIQNVRSGLQNSLLQINNDYGASMQQSIGSFVSQSGLGKNLLEQTGTGQKLGRNGLSVDGDVATI